MADNYIVIDTNTIQNLFAGGGTSAWGQLITGGKKVVFSSVIRDELRRFGGGLAQAFENWASASGVRVVEFELPDLRRPDGSLVHEAGDKTLRALMDPNNADAQAAMRAAGIDAGGTFRLLTDDAGFLKKIWNTTAFGDAALLAEGHTYQPYRGTLEFMAERYANGDIDKAGMSAWLDNFAASGRISSLAETGLNDGLGGKVFKLREQFNAIYNAKDKFLNGDILDGLRETRINILGDQAGSVSVKGGILLGALGLAAKFGVIGDVLAFAVTASTADELRKQGKVSEANKLWTAYLFETSGGILGSVLGAYLTAKVTKGRGGPFAIVVGTLLGGVAGSLAGAPLGEYLYDQHPDVFDPLLNSLYDGVSFDEDFAASAAKKIGFTLDPSEGTSGDDWFLSTLWNHLSGGDGDDFLLGWEPKFFKEGEVFDAALKAQADAAWAAYDAAIKRGETPEVPEIERTAGVAQQDLQQILDGGNGDDWVIVKDGVKATTIGGTGRDWIYNTSKDGIIYGDTIDGLDEQGRVIYEESWAGKETGKRRPIDATQITKRYFRYEPVPADPNAPAGTPPPPDRRIEDQRAKNEQSDLFWWSGDTTIMDAQQVDRLHFFGIPLTGGDGSPSSASLAVAAFSGNLTAAAFVGGATALAAGALNTARRAEGLGTVYYDTFLLNMVYTTEKNADGGIDLLVYNALTPLVNIVYGLGNVFTETKRDADGNVIPNQVATSGIMRIKNFDMANASRHGVAGSGIQNNLFSGFNAAYLSGQGDLNMVFRDRGLLAAIAADNDNGPSGWPERPFCFGDERAAA